MTFEREGSNLRAACTCPAGENGQHCKHRLNLLAGVLDGVVNADSDDVGELKALLAGTDLEEAITVLNDAENQLSKAKQAVLRAKNRLAQVMNH